MGTARPFFLGMHLERPFLCEGGGYTADYGLTRLTTWAAIIDWLGTDMVFMEIAS